MTQAQLADRIGAGHSTVWSWMGEAEGARRPSHETALVIERLTGGDVPAVAWLDSERLAARIGRAVDCS
jgi:hypothetical protein